MSVISVRDLTCTFYVTNDSFYTSDISFLYTTSGPI